VVGAFESRLLFGLGISTMLLLNDQWIGPRSLAIGLWWLGQVSIPSYDLCGTTSNQTVTSGHPNLVVGAFEPRLLFNLGDFSHVSPE
jgi:hypothetical protein